MTDIFEGIEGLTDDVKKALSDKISGAYVARTEFEAVASKKEELLTEAKKAKEAARAADAERQAALKDKAAKDGDIESLKKFYEEEKAKIAAELDGIKTETKRQKINALASDFVKSKFVDDPVVTEAIIAKFSGRVDVRDGKMVVLGADGTLTGLSVDDLKNEFLSTESYKKHIVANRATGGGATGGGQNGGGAAKTMTKAQFDAQTPKQKMEFMRSGGKIN